MFNGIILVCILTIIKNKTHLNNIIVLIKNYVNNIYWYFIFCKNLPSLTIKYFIC